ncbi:MAG: aminotransferase class I/II-fold pyridoxal phosphate-dependent enzyme [Chitinophagales bacterium]|nr:aminotransferase class I/II-fold pyridoxal phosphate-dependent enzyme [Chitinophagales bacterium]
MIDLRSDTVTKPSQAMLASMMTAKLGDDVFGEDPTVQILQNQLADQFGMEAGLFCPSGTMCNQIAMNVHTRPLDEIICDKLSHVYYYETAGYAFNSGCGVRLIDGDQGRITAKQVEESIQADFDWLPVSKLVVVENTCNKGGGAVYEIEELRKIAQICKSKGLKLHLDGARFFNALVASQTNIEEYWGLFDSISICLSKGLGAPIGSVLLGDHAFIKRAKKVRKAFGGGMRQVGILAAAGLYALEHNVSLLQTDHKHATLLAEELSRQKYIAKVITPQTNIVIFDLEKDIEPARFIEYMKINEVMVVQFGPQTIRMVTHLDISEEDVNAVVNLIKRFR